MLLELSANSMTPRSILLKRANSGGKMERIEGANGDETWRLVPYSCRASEGMTMKAKGLQKTQESYSKI